MIVLLHGRAAKPPKEQLRTLWFEALAASLENHSECQERFAASPKEMIYYGDLSNRFLNETCDDIADRRALLHSMRGADFTSYPGETAYGIEEPPDDILTYWQTESEFSQQLRQRVRRELVELLESHQRVLLLAHSLGAVLAYDALSNYGHSRGLTLVTLGSPLTLPHFFEKTAGPIGDLASWHNVSARGDRICGPAIPETSTAVEHELINPMLRDGEPDPHHALGYLCHPEVGRLVKDWLLLCH